MSWKSFFGKRELTVRNMSALPLLLLATRNRGKVREIREILHDIPARIVDLADYPDVPATTENGETLRDNAILKAREAFAATGIPTVSDDSGLEVDALGGRPGVRSARLAGEDVTYEENNLKLLELLRDTPAGSRTARFVCVAAFVDGVVEHVERGECRGRIANTSAGGGGFGYDPIFIPDGSGVSFARMSGDAKNNISHRSEAFRRMKVFLDRYYAVGN